MKILSASGACIALLVFVACSSDDSHPVVDIDTSDASVEDSSANTHNDGALPEDDGGSLPNDGSVDAADSGTPTLPPGAVCDPLQMWAAEAKLAASTAGDDALSSITSDERSIAWVDASDNSVHYADRDDPVDAFGAAKTISTVGLALGERVGLAFDGRTLYAIRADRQGLVAFSRDSRGDSFTSYGTTTLDNLNAEGATLGAGNFFTDLVVSNTVLLVRVTGGASAGIRLASRVLPGDAWSPTLPFAAQSELAVSSGKARRPTGIATDRRALFYWDEVSASEKVALFPFDSATATAFVDLGDRAGAQPNGLCTSLYYSASGDLYTAARK